MNYGENNGVLAGVNFLFLSRAPKFPLPLPLLTPATQVTHQRAQGPIHKNSLWTTLRVVVYALRSRPPRGQQREEKIGRELCAQVGCGR